MTDSDSSVGDDAQTVGDTTRYTTTGLPDQLKHDAIYGYRDVSGPMGRAYQILFDQSWMPYDYKIPDGWELQYARTEWETEPDAHLLKRLISHGDPRVCIVVAEEYDHEW